MEDTVCSGSLFTRSAGLDPEWPFVTSRIKRYSPCCLSCQLCGYWMLCYTLTRFTRLFLSVLILLKTTMHNQVDACWSTRLRRQVTVVPVILSWPWQEQSQTQATVGTLSVFTRLSSQKNKCYNHRFGIKHTGHQH